MVCEAFFSSLGVLMSWRGVGIVLGWSLRGSGVSKSFWSAVLQWSSESSWNGPPVEYHRGVVLGCGPYAVLGVVLECRAQIVLALERSVTLP